MAQHDSGFGTGDATGEGSLVDAFVTNAAMPHSLISDGVHGSGLPDDYGNDGDQTPPDLADAFGSASGVMPLPNGVMPLPGENHIHLVCLNIYTAYYNTSMI